MPEVEVCAGSQMSLLTKHDTYGISFAWPAPCNDVSSAVDGGPYSISSGDLLCDDGGDGTEDGGGTTEERSNELHAKCDNDDTSGKAATAGHSHRTFDSSGDAFNTGRMPQGGGSLDQNSSSLSGTQRVALKVCLSQTCLAYRCDAVLVRTYLQHSCFRHCSKPLL